MASSSSSSPLVPAFISQSWNYDVFLSFMKFPLYDFSTTLFTLFATGVTVYYIVSVFFRRSSHRHQQHSPMSSEEEDVLQSRSMASSSSSSSHSFEHEVFLSFRGEDTRRNFVDHLYTALVQQGIQTYKDDETLPRGERIGPALLKAIQESRIAVVVFSQNYADSSWCLDELVRIMECMDTRGQIVEPVFYFVDPSDVRKQKGKYGKAFTKHVRENKHKVESWRKALEKAGNLSGLVIDENSHEAKCIKEIVGTISSRLSSLFTNVNKDLIGIETRLQDLKSKLKIESGGVRVIGIWGVGGGGKTTLASAAYAEISHRFEGHCLLQNIREESSNPGLTKLQEKFLSLVLKTKDVVVGSEIEGRSMIERRLCRKCILLVLDDVDDVKQLEALAGSHAWFGEGSRIIITTRDEHLLTRHADTIYEVSLLSQDEAMVLFNKHAYRKDKPIEDYEMLSKDVVSYASGLPLALEILGSFLYDKNKDEWKSALAKLKCIPIVKVTERLKISYDGLEPDLQKLFLDIACFWRRRKMDEAMMVLDACNLHPRIGVKVLVQKSLIKVDSYGRFDMHDLVEEMAHYIVRGAHPNNLEKHSRIWKEEDLEELYDMGAEMETEALAFRCYYKDPGLSNAVGVSVAVAKMKKLRWIRFDKYPTSSFPSNFQPTELRCLELYYSQQKELWHGYKSLPYLKILNLSDSKNLIKTPDFEGLPCLEELNLSHCESLEEIHPSIGYHKRLVFVNMTWCTALKRFPPIIQMKKLKTLDLSEWNQLQQFPDIQSNMSLPNLKILNLSRSSKLMRTPDFEGLPCLERLILDGCKRLEEIHPSIGYHKRLVLVDMSRCEGLKRFPPIIQMQTLETLDLSYCSKLQQQFLDIQSNMSLPNLKILDLQSSYNLIKTPDFEGLPCLERLILVSCFSLEEIHPSIGYHKRLVYVNLSWCLRLKSFPPIIHMKKLETLILSECRQLQQFLDIQSNMDSLVTLDLSWTGIEIIPPSVGRLPGLKFLNLSFCESLVELPDLPSSIAILKAHGCDSLEIVRDLSDYKWLWKVSLWGCYKLIGGERVLHSMLEGNAAKDRFMSVLLPVVEPSSRIFTRLVTLQLPSNWYSDFSGLLLFLCDDDDEYSSSYDIDIKQETSTYDYSEESDEDRYDYSEDWEQRNYEMVGYVPFNSLRHIPWLNPTYTKNISFQTNYGVGLNVELVRSKNKIVDLNENPIDYSECWDEEEDRKTFEIMYDSQSSNIRIVWNH